MRTPGKNFDEFYRRAVEEFGVHYVKGMVGKVSEEDGVLKVQASDLLASGLHIDTVIRINCCKLWNSLCKWNIDSRTVIQSHIKFIWILL